MKPFMRGAAIGAFLGAMFGAIVSAYDLATVGALMSIAAQFISNNS